MKSYQLDFLIRVKINQVIPYNKEHPPFTTWQQEVCRKNHQLDTNPKPKVFLSMIISADRELPPLGKAPKLQAKRISFIKERRYHQLWNPMLKIHKHFKLLMKEITMNISPKLLHQWLKISISTTKKHRKSKWQAIKLISLL